MKYFSELVNQSLVRAKESTLSVLGISNPNLREHLQQAMQQECGSKESMMAVPLFEHTFGWTQADKSMNELVGEKLLSQPVIKALDQEKIVDSKGNTVENRYQFKASYKPYTHQLQSWKTLLADKPKSVVVTSGTGSGKTECFMVPVLEDLYREVQQKQQPLSGVRAIFLYPLNALINSQRERLHAWTQAFGKDIRFCLYNGNTEEKANRMKSRQALVPNEVLSRELMRDQPAPILVTNGTMLEYMLVRNVDAPIIAKSKQQKSLRWIVLDEAHTYVGSQAAELSMQLRRVLHAFGVEAKDVRFVATSATIADENAEKQLQDYLAGLAGVPSDQVVVIGGARNVPQLEFSLTDSLALQALMEIAPDKEPGEKGYDPEVSAKRFSALCQSSIAKFIRDKFVGSDKPIKITELEVQLKERFPTQPFNQSIVLNWLDLLTGTKATADSEAFLKVRAHFFQRMINGIWSCIDPDCACKQNAVLKGNWPFGMVYSKQVGKCDCGSPVLEVAFCNDCNEPHLLACDKNGFLAHRDTEVSDEFSLLLETEDELDEEEQAATKKRRSSTALITLRASADKEEAYTAVDINKHTGKLGDLVDTVRLYHIYDRDENRDYQTGCCGYKGTRNSPTLRRAILGAPFYVANVVPTILEFCPDPKVDKSSKLGPQSLPGRGRKLITFTDSRQGTARMAVRMQQEAERNKLRGLVYEVIKKHQSTSPAADKIASDVNLDELRKQVATLKSAGLTDMAEQLQCKIDEAEKSSNGSFEPKFIPWKEVVDELQQTNAIKENILMYNKYANPEVFDDSTGPRKLAEMLLIREFARRPKFRNSLETQGIVKIGYSGLEKVSVMPPNWSDYGLNIDDWRDFLKVTLDFYVRENTYFKLEDDWRAWIGFKFAPKTLRKPDSNEVDENRVKKWPQIKSQLNRLSKLLILGAKLQPDSNVSKELVNEWLRCAWNALTTYKILDNEGNQFFLNRDKLTFGFAEHFFVCPVTNKLLDTTFKGLTPYLPRKFEESNFECRREQMPPIWTFDISQYDYQEGLDKVRQLANEDASVQHLRAHNLWTDINDRVVEGGFYYRTAEHSAQQSADRLNKYESMFKEGKVNVLNCSTTMEMGVDIGGISAVVMNNVPPHPANYLQRAGRAGRSKESRAISYTLCKNNPHDNEVFNDPLWPFVTAIPAPQISLDSVRLVQRHVNSLLLSIFLKSEIGPTQKEKTNLSLEWFFGEVDGLSICAQFMGWMDANSSELGATIEGILKGTGLAKVDKLSVIQKTKEAIDDLNKNWVEQYKKLKNAEEKAVPQTAYEYKVKVELTRHANEYLLKELAARAFLPGYGFPTDIVTFNNKNIIDFKRKKKGSTKNEKNREDNISQLREMPTRNLAVAIREYAPGSEVVLDGRVFKSSGIALNWQKLSSNAREAQKFDIAWRCDSCGHSGVESNASVVDDWDCSSCGAQIKNDWKKNVIQPTGFVTDFFSEPSNDITAQKYIAVQAVRVSIASEVINLPNPRLGYMAYGSDATIFQHSSGVNGQGYAVCMQCGKAESMLADGEFPKELTPNSQHKPITSTPNSRDRDGFEPMYCDGSATVYGNVHLGCSSLTDAFEIVLRNPVNGEYIDPNMPDAESVALTISVALRNALASKLGISTSELGYATRQTRVPETNAVAMAIQIYDSVSGGAGFSTSAAGYIEDLLKATYENLACSASCDSACSSCILDSHTRHDANYLNRNVAKDWLGKNFIDFVGLDSQYQLIEGAKYCHEPILEAVSQQINRGAKNIRIWMGEDINEWDLNARTVQMLSYQMLNIHGVGLTLVLPDTSLGESELIVLARLKDLGVEFGHCDTRLGKGVLAAQALFENGRVYTVASETEEVINPNQHWLGVLPDNMVVYSESFPRVSLTSVDTAEWYSVNSRDFAKIELGTELDGAINGFGDRFWKLIGERLGSLADDLSTSQVKHVFYTDRYLQSPWYIILLGEIIRALPRSKNTSLELETLFKSNSVTGRLICHDWDNSQAMEQVISTWFEKGISTPCYLDLHHQRDDITHRRELQLTFSNGNKYSLSLDQGMGYWKNHLDRGMHRFDFGTHLDQLSQMERAWKKGGLRAMYQWKTIIYTLKYGE